MSLSGERSEKLKEWLEGGKAVYADQERKADWVRRIGLPVAESGSPSPSIESIPSKADFVKATGSESLLQGEEGAARGEFDPATNLIRLMKTAAPSTFPHELAHFILESAFRHVWKGEAGADYLENWCQLLGVPSSGGTKHGNSSIRTS